VTPEGEALIFMALFSTDKEAAEKRLFCALRASLRQRGSVIFQRLTALFCFAHPWLKAMGYQVVP